MGKVICRYEENAPLKELVSAMSETRKNIHARQDFLARQMKKLQHEANEDIERIWRLIEKEIDAQKLLPPGMNAKAVPIKIDEDVGCIRFSDTPQNPFTGPFFPSAG